MPHVLVILIFFSLGRNVYRDIYFAGRRFAGIVEFAAEPQPLHRYEPHPHTTLEEGSISIDVGVIPLFPCGAGVVCAEARSENTAEGERFTNDYIF